MVDKKYGISSEGANLSGLEEEPSDLEKLVWDLLKERFDTKKASVVHESYAIPSRASILLS